MLDEIASKASIKTKKGINREKRSKILNGNVSFKTKKNQMSFSEINPVQEEALPSNKLQNHSYE